MKKQLLLDSHGAAWFDEGSNCVGIGAGYDHVELNTKTDVVKLIAFLVKALARMK